MICLVLGFFFFSVVGPINGLCVFLHQRKVKSKWNPWLRQLVHHGVSRCILVCHPFCDVDLKLRRQPVVQSFALQDLPVAGHVGVQTRGHDTGRSRRKEQLLAKLQRVLELQRHERLGT